MEKLSTQYIDLGEVKIACREYSAGPALILLHGNSMSKGMFADYQMVHFNQFRTLAVDSRGHGETISDDQRYSIEQYADDVIALCQTRGIHRAFVIGYSDGGNIALFLAKKAPDLFTKIVAISPNYLVSGTTDGMLRFFRAISKVLRALQKIGLPTRKALMRFDLMLNDIGLTPADLGSIRTSLRILYAEHDMIKEQHIQEIARLVPGATLKKIMQCSHMNIYRRTEAIEDIQNYFLAAG